MGYFSNSTEGQGFYHHYCNNCVHEDPENGKHCPIWQLHQWWNYEQFPEQVPEDAIEEIAEQQLKKDVLDSFIISGDEGQECTMFFPESKVKGKTDPSQLSLLDTMFDGKIQR